jgi:hypothetical protein
MNKNGDDVVRCLFCNNEALDNEKICAECLKQLKEELKYDDVCCCICGGRKNYECNC